MSNSELSEWVRCPNCFLDLEPVAERTLGCAAGHRFDLHRHGYATLLPPRAPAHHGDTREMLAARELVLGSGVYEPIVDAVVALASPSLGGAAPARLIDFGCGTGHYSRAVAATATQGAQVLFTDRSPAAVRWSTLALPDASGVVLDVWAPLPIRDGVADLALDVFAPRNPAEFARVLRPDGRVVVVVPRASHLAELRAGGGMLDVPEGKAEGVAAQFAPFFELASTRSVEAEVLFSAEQAAATRGMGPAGHHELERRSESEPVTATLAVDVLAFQRLA